MGQITQCNQCLFWKHTLATGERLGECQSLIFEPRSRFVLRDMSGVWGTRPITQPSFGCCYGKERAEDAPTDTGEEDDK